MNVLVTNPKTIMTLPEPPRPPTEPTPENVAAWERDMAYWRGLADVERIAASDRHGAAQQATAEAMDRHADKQQALIDAMSAPSPLPTRAALIWQAVLAHPQVTDMTWLNVVDACTKEVDGFLSRHPEAVA